MTSAHVTLRGSSTSKSNWKSWWDVGKVGFVVLAVIVVIATLSRWSATPKQVYDVKWVSKVKKMLGDSRKWANRAEEDAKNQHALMSVIHATYAVAYTNAVRAMIPDKDLEKLTGSPIDEHLAKQRTLQQQAIRQVGAICPNALPNGIHALNTGWLS